jgi:hypothetical protein
MAARIRRFLIAGCAPALLLACSGDNKSDDGGADASDSGGSGDVTASDVKDGGGSDVTQADATHGDAQPNGDAADSSAVDAQPDGDGAVACTTAQYTHVSTFGAIFDGWTVAANSSTTLVPGTSLDGAMTGTLLELDPTVGSPTPGSAKLTIPFSQPGEQLLFAFNSTAPLNLTGTTITAQIKLDSGLNVSPVNPGQAFLVLKSTLAYIYAPAPAIFLDSTANFVTLSMSADAPTASVPGYTACDIREIDIVIQTGNMGTYTTAVVHIDTIAITAPGVDAGTDDGGPPVQGDAAPDGADAAASDAADAGG